MYPGSWIIIAAVKALSVFVGERSERGGHQGQGDLQDHRGGGTDCHHHHHSFLHLHTHHEEVQYTCLQLSQ